MILIAPVPLIACILGLVLWFVPSNGKINEIGKLTFFAGMLAWLFAVSGHSVRM